MEGAAEDRRRERGVLDGREAETVWEGRSLSRPLSPEDRIAERDSALRVLAEARRAVCRRAVEVEKSEQSPHREARRLNGRGACRRRARRIGPHGLLSRGRRGLGRRHKRIC
eukprot:3677514-Pleurochrysis_carterae.AAC.2